MTTTAADPFAAPTAPTSRRGAHASPVGGGAIDGPAPAPAAPMETAADPGAKASSRSRGMAVAGSPAQVPPTPPSPTWAGPLTGDDGYSPSEEFDAKDLSEVNRELNRCRARLFRVSGALREAQRQAAAADLAYRRAMRRALVQVSGGSAETRKAMAELQCEALENDVVVAQQVAEEWKKRAVDARDDLKAVENLAHNVRAQMDIR